MPVKGLLPGSSTKCDPSRNWAELGKRQSATKILVSWADLLNDCWSEDKKMSFSLRSRIIHHKI